MIVARAIRRFIVVTDLPESTFDDLMDKLENWNDRPVSGQRGYVDQSGIFYSVGEAYIHAKSWGHEVHLIEFAREK